MLLLPGSINPTFYHSRGLCVSRETGFLHQYFMARLLLSFVFPRSNGNETGQGYSQSLNKKPVSFHSRYRAFISAFWSCDAQMTECE